MMAPAGPFLSRPHMLRSRAALGYPSLARRQRAGLLGELDHGAFNLMEVRDDLFSADNDKCPQAQADAEGDAKSQEAARAVRQCVAPVALTIQQGNLARGFSRLWQKRAPGRVR